MWNDTINIQDKISQSYFWIEFWQNGNIVLKIFENVWTSLDMSISLKFLFVAHILLLRFQNVIGNHCNYSFYLNSLVLWSMSYLYFSTCFLSEFFESGNMSFSFIIFVFSLEFLNYCKNVFKITALQNIFIIVSDYQYLLC